jgi:uncharacterized RDD family membrane protein YckC
MLSVKLDTGFNIEIDFPISPFHRRMFAWCIDMLIIYIYILIVEKIFSTTFTRALAERAWISLLFALPIIFYYPASEIISNGRTIGKQLQGISVITTEGGHASVSQYILRWIFRMVDFPVWIFAAIFNGILPWWCSVLTFSGIACVIITSKSQRIGDIIAGTIVIYTKDKTSWEDTVFTEVETTYKPLYPQVMQLSDKDINSLKTIIENTKKSNDRNTAFRIAERIKAKFVIQGDQDALDFLETLLKDYNYYTAG